MIDTSEILNLCAKNIQEFDFELLYYPVSSTKRLPSNYPLEACKTPTTLFNSKEISTFTKPYLEELLNQASNLFDVNLVSGFRSIKYQDQLFEKYVNDYMVLHSCNKEIAEREVSRESAKPGYSEHHLGTAIDILERCPKGTDMWQFARSNYNKSFYKWLRENSFKYGYVISYPTGSNAVDSKEGSGYPSAEPWHLRFVGIDVATFLYQNKYLDPDNPLTLNYFLKQIYREIAADIKL